MTDLVEEWKKRDPYFLDTEGFLKFVEQKEKELRVKIQVCIDKGYNGGYEIYLEVPIDEIPDEYKNTDILQKAKELERTVEKIREFFSPNMDRCAPNKLGLKPGATTIFRSLPLPIVEIGFLCGEKEKEALTKIKNQRLESGEKEEWYYYGDYSHIPAEDIDNNAKILWKIWRIIGSHLPNVCGVSKDYQCDSRSVYLRYDANTSKKTDFPALGRYEMSLERTMEEAERWNERIKPLETEEPEGPTWEELHLLAWSLLLEEIPNLDDPFEDGYVWVTQDDLLVCRVYKPSIPDVMNYLVEGREAWDPENDVELMREGGLELIHPFLREQRTFVWRREDVEWDPEASYMRDLYYTRFIREELEAMKIDKLKDICKAKNIQVKHSKYDMIDAILEMSYKSIKEQATVVA